MERLIRSGLVVLGLVTATPVAALFEPDVLDWTYGVTEPGATVTALLVHRGVLQLALGAALVWAAYFPPARVAAAATAVVTKGTFLALVLPDPAIRSGITGFSIWFDSLCIVLLTALVIRELAARRRGPVVVAGTAHLP